MATHAGAVTRGLALLRGLRPASLRRLAGSTLREVIRREALAARPRVRQLTARFPSASPRELAHRLIEEKKGLASAVGGVSGLFGLLALPADQLVLLPYLQLRLLAELATLYKVNLKSPSAQTELLELFWYANGVGQLPRSGPRVLASVGALLLSRGGLRTVGRALPLAGAAVSAYFNNQHLQVVGEEALRHFEGFGRARRPPRPGTDGSGA